MTRTVTLTHSDNHARREAFYHTMRRDIGRRYRQFDLLSAEVCFNIAQTFTRAEIKLAEKIHAVGLTLAGFNVLLILSQYKEAGCAQNALSHLLVVSRANITGVVDSLIRKGLVTRSENSKDRRVVMARLTHKGAELLHSYLPVHYGFMRKLTACLTAAEKTSLIRLLTKARQGFIDLNANS